MQATALRMMPCGGLILLSAECCWAVLPRTATGFGEAQCLAGSSPMLVDESFSALSLGAGVGARLNVPLFPPVGFNDHAVLVTGHRLKCSFSFTCTWTGDGARAR